MSLRPKKNINNLPKSENSGIQEPNFLDSIYDG